MQRMNAPIRPLGALAALGSALALSACAMDDNEPQSAAASSSERQCFWAGSVSGFRDAPERDTIYIDVGVNDTYEFKTFGACPDLDFTETLALRSRGGNYICDAMDVDLIVPDSLTGPDRCPVRMIRKLEPGEPGAQ